MHNRTSFSFRLLAPMAALGLAACAGGTDGSSAAAPTGPLRVLTTATAGQAGDRAPQQGELEICKDGDAASFEITGLAVSPTTVNLADGECRVIAVDKRTGLDTLRLTVTELASATSTFTSVTATTLHNEYDVAVNGAGPDVLPPDVVTSTSSSTVNVKLNEYIGTLLEYVNTKNPPVVGCTYTQGWYKNHTTQWPAGFSPTATFDGWKTWIDLYNTPPKGGSAYIQLAHQYMTALMNASAASVPADVQDALDKAAAYFAAGGNGTGSGDIAGVAAILDAYNNGFTGPGHCE
jgi:hypothetical protein